MKTSNKVNFSNPLEGGYDIFKRVFGFILVIAALWGGYVLISVIVNHLEGERTLEDLKIIENYIPQDPEERQFKFLVQQEPNGPHIEQIIEFPKYSILLLCLLLALIACGIILRFLIAILNAGVALLRDDVSHVFEQLRKEISKGKLHKY